MVSGTHTAAVYEGESSHPLAPGAHVALAPENGVQGDTRWLSGALVVSPTQGGSSSDGVVTLRRPRLQKPLVLTISRREGRFGIGLDEDNRIVEMKPGCSARDAGMMLGDQVCRVDGVDIHSAGASSPHISPYLPISLPFHGLR